MVIGDSKKFYVTKGFVDMETLAKDTVYFLENRKKIEKAQYCRIENGFLIQAKDPIFSAKGLLGLNQAIEFQLMLVDGTLTVNIGAGAWLTNLAILEVGMFVKDYVFAPLVIPHIVGLVKQCLLLFEVYKFIEKYVTNPEAIIDFLRNGISETESDNIGYMNSLLIYRVSDAFFIKNDYGYGMTVTGKVESGSMSVNDDIVIVSPTGKRKKTKILSIETFSSELKSATKGDNVGIRLDALTKDDIKTGDIICAPDTNIETGVLFIAGLYPLTKKQGGRYIPLFEDCVYDFDISLGNDILEGKLHMEDDDDDIMIMPGEGKFVIVELCDKRTLYKGMEFNIVENGNVRAQGVVKEIHE